MPVVDYIWPPLAIALAALFIILWWIIRDVQDNGL